MKLNDQVVRVGQVLFIKGQTPSGKTSFKKAEVIDTNEKPAAVKVRYAVGKATLKSGWFAPVELAWSKLPVTPK